MIKKKFKPYIDAAIGNYQRNGDDSKGGDLMVYSDVWYKKVSSVNSLLDFVTETLQGQGY